jgi:hypothetical protein
VPADVLAAIDVRLIADVAELVAAAIEPAAIEPALGDVRQAA